MLTGQSMFYRSVAWNAPLFELRVERGEHIALSRWRVTERLVIERLGSDRPSEPAWRPRAGSTDTPANRFPASSPKPRYSEPSVWFISSSMNMDYPVIKTGVTR
jgi:hypothetical protein